MLIHRIVIIRALRSTVYTWYGNSCPHVCLFNRDIAKLQEQARRKAAEDGDDDERFQDPDNETGLFNTAPYEADDEEADQIYEAIDAKLDERRKARRYPGTHASPFCIYFFNVMD